MEENKTGGQVSIYISIFSFIFLLASSLDRHCIFLICNGILLFLFFDSQSQTPLPHKHAMGSESECTQEPQEKVEANLKRVLVTSVVEEETQVKEMEQGGGMLDDEVSLKTEDEVFEDAETEKVDDEHEMVATVEDEDDEHEMVATVEDYDEEEVFQKYCEAFIKKVRSTMHHEAYPNPHACPF